MDDTRATNASWSACQMLLHVWRANVTHMLCECYANVTRMLYRWGALHMRDIRVANAMQNAIHRRDIRVANAMLNALHPTWEARFIAWVTFGQYCMIPQSFFRNLHAPEESWGSPSSAVATAMVGGSLESRWSGNTRCFDSFLFKLI
jgi:hypothetical protein